MADDRDLLKLTVHHDLHDECNDCIPGPRGLRGFAGPPGSDGIPGRDGKDGWSPILSVVPYGNYRVMRIDGWTGGTGIPPGGVGFYIGPNGLTPKIEEATNIRGEPGKPGVPGVPGRSGGSSIGYIAENVAHKGQPGGYASLNDQGKVLPAQLPAGLAGLLTIAGVIHVAKSGDDANDGLTSGTPKASLQAAIDTALNATLNGTGSVPADNNRIVIQVADAGIYQESITLPANVDLLAPSATIIGTASNAPTLMIEGNCHADIFRVKPSPFATPDDLLSNSAIMKQTGGFGFVRVKEVWSQTGGLGIASISPTGALHAVVGVVHVAANSFGVGGGFSNSSGHLHLYAGDIYFEGDGAIGVVAGANTSQNANVLGTVEHMISRGGPYNGTVGFAALGGEEPTFARIIMFCGQLIADTEFFIAENSFLRVQMADGRVLGSPSGQFGLPPSGSTGQMLRKVSDADYDAGWADLPDLSSYEQTSNKGNAGGYASLDNSGKVPVAQIPITGGLQFQSTWDASTNTPAIPSAVGRSGYFYSVSVAGTTNIDGNSNWQVGDWLLSDGATWSRVPSSSAVSSVAGKTGAVTLNKSDVGLGNIDNTSDANKPVSTAQQSALNLKADASALASYQQIADKAQANGYASLDGTGKVPTSQLPSSVLGDVAYQGVWDANANSPVIPAAAAGNKGWYYVVSVAGSTNINGVTVWNVGDWLVSNGSSWDKIDNTDLVSSVAGKTGAVTLVVGDVTDAFSTANIDTDSAMTANSDTKVASQKAVKTALATKQASLGFTAENAANKGANSGYCGLDSSGLIAVANLPGQAKGINTQTDNYTLALTDAGKIVELNKATAITLTVPTNASVAFPVNTVIDLSQYGAGQVTVAAAGGVTIRSSGSKLKLTGQYSGATLYKRGTDEWVLIGDLTA